MTPVAWLELRHPGSVFVVQSMGRASEVGIEELMVSGAPRFLRLSGRERPGSTPANHTTILRNSDGSRPDVYGAAVLADIVDAVILWDPENVSLQEADSSAIHEETYRAELDRRAAILSGGQK